MLGCRCWCAAGRWGPPGVGWRRSAALPEPTPGARRRAPGLPPGTVACCAVYFYGVAERGMVTLIGRRIQHNIKGRNPVRAAFVLQVVTDLGVGVSLKPRFCYYGRRCVSQWGSKTIRRRVRVGVCAPSPTSRTWGALHLIPPNRAPERGWRPRNLAGTVDSHLPFDPHPCFCRQLAVLACMSPRELLLL